MIYFLLVFQSNTKEWLDNLFMSYGFRVNVIGYDEVAKMYARDSVVGEYDNLLFVAEHLRFSDDQVSINSFYLMVVQWGLCSPHMLKPEAVRWLCFLGDRERL